MKVPECCIEQLNKIIEKSKKCNSSLELFHIYKDLWEIREIFGIYRTSIDEDYNRLLNALIEIEIEIAIRLCNYDESQKRKGL